MVILDTNILIDHLRRPQREETHLEQIAKQYPKETFAISIITVQELYGGRSTKDKNQAMYVLSLLARLKILPYTYGIAQLAGEIARDLNRSIEFPDAAIAATAIVNDCQLATLNQRDFKGITHLELKKLTNDL